MTIAFDTFVSTHTFDEGGGDPTWNHTSAAGAKGGTVTIHGYGTASSGVTWGGVSMTEMPSSPLNKATTEAMNVQGFYLGSSFPTGTQSIVVANADEKLRCWSWSFTGAADLTLQDDVTFSSDAATAPTGTLALGGNTCYCAVTWRSGHNAVTGPGPGTGWGSDVSTEVDIGTQTVGDYSYDTIGSSNVDISGSISQTSEDLIVLAWAMTESGGAGGSAFFVPAIVQTRRNHGFA